MSTPKNPKQEGTDFWDCRPQTGKCPMQCNQCFYNREGAFYCNPNEPYVPDPAEVGEGLVRFNCGHDSNFDRDNVIKLSRQYKRFFFNTSVPRFDFPGPVVFTANPKEEKGVILPSHRDDWKFDNLMFVRLRVSPTNLHFISNAVRSWTVRQIPVVLTFMAYYDQKPPGTYLGKHPDYPQCYCWRNPVDNWSIPEEEKHFVAYVWKQRHINSYYCPTPAFMAHVLLRMKKEGGRLVTMCGGLYTNYCRDCRNCETYYIQTMKHLAETV